LWAAKPTTPAEIEYSIGKENASTLKRSLFLCLAQLLNLQAVWLDVMLLNMKPYSEDYRVVERNSQHNIGPNNMGRFGIFEAHCGGDGELALIHYSPNRANSQNSRRTESLVARVPSSVGATDYPV